MFTIHTDTRRRLVMIKIAGMLTIDQVRELYRQEHDAIRAMGCPIGEHLVLVDLTACPLQLQDIDGAFKNGIEASTKAKRLAMVTGSSLARMQARRILRRSDAGMFETEAEALTWMFGTDAVRQAA